MLTSPLGGPPDEVLATLRPEDIEAVLVHRGPALERDGQIVVQGRALQRVTGYGKGGFGLVKIVFAHGEGGNKTPDMPPVMREDILALPRMIRDFEPVAREYGENGFGTTRWNIPRTDGKHLVIVAGRGADGADSRLVTMFVDGGDIMSSKRKSASVLSPHRKGVGKDTSQGISVFTPDSRSGSRHMTKSSMPAGLPDVNAGMKALAPEEVEALRLKEEGRAKPEDIEVARLAEEDAARIDTNENAALAVTECIIGSAD